jgi:hypothetical protein
MLTKPQIEMLKTVFDHPRNRVRSNPYSLDLLFSNTLDALFRYGYVEKRMTPSGVMLNLRENVFLTAAGYEAADKAGVFDEFLETMGGKRKTARIKWSEIDPLGNSMNINYEPLTVYRKAGVLPDGLLVEIAHQLDVRYEMGLVNEVFVLLSEPIKQYRTNWHSSFAFSPELNEPPLYVVPSIWVPHNILGA